MIQYVKNVRGGELTYQFLSELSKHLSTRRSCKKLEYSVFIGCVVTPHIQSENDTVISNAVIFWPREEVYPDRFHRKLSDKQLLINHIMDKHFKDEVFDCYDAEGLACFKLGSLIPGTYKYALSATGKQRRWVRVD